MSTQRSQSNPVVGLRNCARGFVLPSRMKFKSGHLPSGIVPVLGATGMRRNNDLAGSDMEICTDSDDEGYGIQHSLDSSPQDDKIPNANGHSEFSSYVEKISNMKALNKQGFYGQGNNNLAADAPSAPPLSSSVQEINTVAEQFSTCRANRTPCPGNSSVFSKMDGGSTTKSTQLRSKSQDSTTNRISDPPVRNGTVSSCSILARLPTFHASALGPWYAVCSYEACVRLCLHSWATGCLEAPIFLENECALLRNAFGLHQVLLQPEEELLRKRSSELVSEGAALKPKKTFGKMKIQVKKVKMALDPPTGCSFSSLKQSKVKLESLRLRMSNVKSTLSSEWKALRKDRVAPPIPANGSFSCKSMAYVHACTHYLKEVSGLVRIGVTTFRNNSSSYEVVQETYSCSLRLKSSTEEDTVRIQPGSNETHVFLPDGLGDDLVIDVLDSKGKYYGRVVAQVADIAEDPCGPVAETVAYDLVLEAALKAQHIQQRNLLIHGTWRWLVTEFGSYYGISDAYTKLRYLSYVMDVATPTADCLNLVYELLLPVVMKGKNKRALSHQEVGLGFPLPGSCSSIEWFLGILSLEDVLLSNRILGEISVQIEQTIALVFENYKSLDESSPSGMMDVLRPASGLVAPALAPALKLYTLLYDILSPEAQLKQCSLNLPLFEVRISVQTAVKKRCRRHLAETDELLTSNSNNSTMDPVLLNLHHRSFVDLPNLSSSIYSTGLCNRLRAFFEGSPPNGLSPPVTELVIATADFQRDLSEWNISPIKGGVDAKELFHSYIIRWIEEKRLALLELCKVDKVKWSSVRSQNFTNPFVDDMYDRLKETLVEYEVILHRWPEYAFVLESAIADVERAIVEILDKNYADVLSPLRDNMIPIKLGLKYVQKIAKGNVCPYTVPDELGILLNSMKRMLDVLRPKIETQLKFCVSCIPNGGSDVPGDRLSEVTVMLRTKFKSYIQAVVEKLAENSRLHNATKLKKIIQEANESIAESDVRGRMQPLKDLVAKTIDYLHSLFDTQLFLIICRGFWDCMGQDVLRILQSRKDNMGCYKGSRVILTVLDDMFALEIQQLLGNALQEKDLQPPRSIVEVRAMLCKDAGTEKGNNYYY
ncbi:hypothetical protein LguiA_013697 [Lonicera macranthoides]